MRRFQNRSRRVLTELWVDWSQDSMLAHNDLIGGERDQCTARHGIVRHEHSDLAFMFEYRARDLGRCQDQASRSVQHQIQRNFWVRQMNRTKDLFTVVNVDVAKQ